MVPVGVAAGVATGSAVAGVPDPVGIVLGAMVGDMVGWVVSGATSDGLASPGGVCVTTGAAGVPSEPTDGAHAAQVMATAAMRAAAAAARMVGVKARSSVRLSCVDSILRSRVDRMTRW